MQHGRLMVNVSANVINLMVNLVITLVMTPIYLAMLGHYDYGLWEIIIAVIGYMGLLDLGLRSAIVRYVSVLLSQAKYADLKQLYSTAMCFMTMMGLGLFICISWLAYTHSPWLGLDTADGKYQSLIYLTGLAVWLSFMRNVAEGALEGRQAFVAKNLVNLSVRIAGTLYLYQNLTPSSGILMLASVVIVTSLVRLILYNILLISASPAILPTALPSWLQLNQLIRFGLKSLINGVAVTVQSASGAFLIGMLLGPALVPLYSIPYALINYIRNLIESSGMVFLPYFSEFYAQEDIHDLRDSYLLFSKIIVSGILLLVVIINFIGADFIQLWLNGALPYTQTTIILALLSAVIVIEKINPLGLRLLTAMNAHIIYAKLRPIAAILTLASSYLLLQRIGIVGAALASLLSYSLFAPIFLYHCCRHLKINHWHYIKRCLLSNYLLFSFMLAVTQMFKQTWVFDSYLAIALGILSVSAAGMVGIWFCVLCAVERRSIIKNIVGFMPISWRQLL